jgi:transcriptional regulator with XRE-family HTH domain
MIKNERQYRVTAAEAERFAETLANYPAHPPPASGIHPEMWAAQRTAIESQLGDLRQDLVAYEELKEGSRQAFGIRTWEDVPRALIEGRIAAGLTQKELAERLGVPEQQVQRYESTDYASASLARLREVAEAIDLKLSGVLARPDQEVSAKRLLARLSDLGLDRNWAMNRLFPASVTKGLEAPGRGKSGAALEVLRAASLVERVFRIPFAALFGTSPVRLQPALAGQTFFKRAKQQAGTRKVDAYTFYAHYLALVLLHATKHLERRERPSQPADWRKAIVEDYGAFTFETALRYVWSCGIPVLPLSDVGAFHGACWRTDDREIIVLKQRTRSQDRWLFDLFHEIKHILDAPPAEPIAIVESGEPDSTDPAEAAAMEFAGAVVLNDQADELAERAVAQAAGIVERLKRVVPRVADEAHVSQGALANYLAFRIAKDSEGEISWWGTANSLQTPGEDPWETARDVLLEHADFDAINNRDRELLLQALSRPEERTLPAGA